MVKIEKSFKFMILDKDISFWKKQK